MRKEPIQKGKNTNKKILPFVMSTSMITAALFATGPSVFADEGEKEPDFRNHGAEVSYFAKTVPASPDKGKIMRTIASKKWKERAQNDGNDENESVDPSGDENESAEDPADENEDAEETDDENESVEVPADENDSAEEPGDENESAEDPADENDSAEEPGDENESAEDPVDENE
ncbi:hypothetical protein IPU62_06015, partial [Pseudogracilibacillus auburnensis]|nr:hypothetical protein [Pseudogracilibacillus auburnensis]